LLKVYCYFGRTCRLHLQGRRSRPSICSILVSSFDHCSNLKMEATCSSEVSVDFQRTTGHYIPLLNHPCGSLKSYVFFILSGKQQKMEKDALSRTSGFRKKSEQSFSPLCYWRKKVVSPSLLDDSNSRSLASSVFNNKLTVHTRLERVCRRTRISDCLTSIHTTKYGEKLLSAWRHAPSLSLSLSVTHTHT
jgi:hypothetical protein